MWPWLALSPLGVRQGVGPGVFAALERGADVIYSDKHPNSFMLRVDAGRTGTAICSAKAGLECCTRTAATAQAWYLVCGGRADLPFAAEAGLEDQLKRPLKLGETGSRVI